MRAPDLARLLSLVRDARTGGSFAERAAAVDASLQRLVPHSHLTAVPLVRVGGRAPAGADAYVSPALLQAWASTPPYHPHYFEADPRRPLFPNGFGRIAVPSGGTLHLSAVLDGAPFGRDAFTGEFLRFTDTRYLVDLILDRPDGAQFTFSLLRERRQGDFLPRELRLLEAIAPDLTLMTQVAALEEELVAPRAGSATTVFLADPRAELLFAGEEDQAALRALESSGAPLRPTIRACVAQLTARGARAGELCAAVMPGGSGWLRITCGLLTGGGRVVVKVEPLAPGSPEHFAAEADRAGLSERERDVARLAARGLSDREIAGALRVAIVTVKAHLRSVYRKTGARGRNRLAARLLGLPAG